MAADEARRTEGLSVMTGRGEEELAGLAVEWGSAAAAAGFGKRQIASGDECGGGAQAGMAESDNARTAWPSGEARARRSPPCGRMKEKGLRRWGAR
jgi:hypothetical protein